MTKFILLLFGYISRIVFEFGVPVLAFLLWGWHVGLAFTLWYILWTWTGFSVIQMVESEIAQKEKEMGKSNMSNDDLIKEILKKLAIIAEEAKEEAKREKEEKTVMSVLDDKNKKN